MGYLAFCYSDKIPEVTSLMQERFILTHSMRGCSPGSRDLLRWACDSTVHGGGVHVRGELEQRKEEDRVPVPTSPSRPHPRWPDLTQPVPPPKASATLRRTKPLTPGPGEDTPDPNYSTWTSIFSIRLAGDFHKHQNWRADLSYLKRHIIDYVDL